MTGSTAALVSFRESSGLLHELAGVKVSVSQVERAAEALGAEIGADERTCVERMGEVAPTMYLGMDGTGVPMRAAEVAGRAGKQPDGSAKTREAKVVTVWTAEARDDRRQADARSGIDHLYGRHRKRRRSGYQPDTIRPRRARVARSSAAADSPRLQVRGAGRWFSLDLEHGQGTISAEPSRSSTAIMPKKLCTEPLTLSLAQPAHKRNHGPRRVARNWTTESCTPSSPRSGPISSSSKEAAKCALYIFRNRRRMRYPKFHRQGLCTSTGVLEAGCKVVIGTRLKRAGMHWTASGANAIIALRCAKLSGRFEDFWERRSTPVGAAA